MVLVGGIVWVKMLVVWVEVRRVMYNEGNGFMGVVLNGLCSCSCDWGWDVVSLCELKW